MKFQPLFPDSLFFQNFPLEVLHSWDESFGSIFYVLTILSHHLASTTFCMLILSLTYLWFDPRFSVKIGVGILTSGIFNSLAKFFWESPRPTGLSDAFLVFQESTKEGAFGFPSGHSHLAVVLWGMIFLRYSSRSTVLKYLSLFVIIISPWTRMYAGVHYWGDVLGGMAMGAIHLMILEWIFARYPEFPNLEGLPEEGRPRIARSLSLTTFAITLLVTLLEEPSQTTFHKSSLAPAIASAGALAGFFWGLIWLPFVTPYNKDFWESWENVLSERFIQNKKDVVLLFLVRFLFLTVAILLFYVLPSLLQKAKGWDDFVLFRYAKYAVLGLGISLFTPWVLSRIQNRKFLKDMP